MADTNNNSLKMWHDAAAASKECLPLETLEQFTEIARADAKAAAHLDSCAHCQTELSMLQSFESATPTADEGAAVAWIAAQLERQQSAPAKPVPVARVSFWKNLFRVPYLAGAAALAAVLVLGISLHNSNSSDHPAIGGQQVGTSVYRGGLKLLGPTGELTQAPNEFRWEAYQGAASYKVELTDAVGTPLASATSTQPQLAVTPEMRVAMHARMPISWKVTALDATGNKIAESSGGSFKIK
jgi:hypothetical protein